MREIKFRAYWMPGKVMISSQHIESINFETKVLGVYHPIGDIGFHRLRISDFNIMQFTGLLDKNGKGIYEGDILSNGQHIDWIVNYKNASFSVYHVDSITSDTWCLKKGMAESREIIGNIHENPELLS